MVRVASIILVSAIALPGTLDAQTQAPPSADPQTINAPTATVMNPKVIEFEIPEQSSPVMAYRLEVFRSGTDTTSAQANWVVDIPQRDVPLADGVARVDLVKALDGIPNGEYVATLRVLGSVSDSPRSSPTQPFTIVDMSRRSSSNAGIPGTVAQPGSPVSGAPQNAPPERLLWTIIGIAMGVAAFIGPVVLR